MSPHPIPPADPAQGGCTRRAFVKSAAAAALAPLTPLARGADAARADVRSLAVALEGPADLTVDGPHVFRQIRGRTGLHVTSLKTRARLATDLHREPRGTLSFWFSPLEDLTSCPPNNAESKVPFDFSFVADVFPALPSSRARFGVAFLARYPAVVARFAPGEIFPKLDFELAPFVYAEKVLLRQRHWYQLTLTWDRPAKRLRLYLNGRLAGLNDLAENFEEPAPELFLGNPMMVLRDLRLENRALDANGATARYRETRPAENDPLDADLRRLLAPAFLAPLDLRRDAAWQPAYEAALTSARDLAGWVRQGPGEEFMSEFRMEATAEGLYLQTPAKIHRETRMYLWSPRPFEGDQWIEFDFRIESPRGLALLCACVSGMLREDSFADHGVPRTGGMVTILRDVRNYHWEYVRRVEAMRTDVETQYVNKNPFGRTLHCACVPRLEQNRWYRLRFIKAGPRLHGSFDGQTVFDVVDDPFAQTGPVYDFGRIGLRQMYGTALRYRHLTVHQRPPAET